MEKYTKKSKVTPKDNITLIILDYDFTSYGYLE